MGGLHSNIRNTTKYKFLEDAWDAETLLPSTNCRESGTNDLQLNSLGSTCLPQDYTPDDDLVTINVSGTTFVTTLTSLNKYPSTLLGCEEERNKHFSAKLNAFYFNRHRPCFDSILHFYQTGKEAPPLNVDPDVYAREKEFFGIKREKEIQLAIPEPSGEQLECMGCSRSKIHHFMQDPRSSKIAACWHAMDIIFICISICFLIFETDPNLGKHFEDNTDPYYNTLFWINAFVMVFFTVDILLRLVTWPRFLDFWKNIFNLLDILSILPFYVGLIADDINGRSEDAGDMEIQANKQHYVVLRVCRIFRIVRIFKFIRHSRDLLIIMKAVSNAKRELFLLILLLFIFVITFGSIMYYIESTDNPQFNSIMKSCWWVIVTITTVGYGDIYPITVGGKLFGGFVLTLGIVFLALPMTIIVSKFSFVYEREKM